MFWFLFFKVNILNVCIFVVCCEILEFNVFIWYNLFKVLWWLMCFRVLFYCKGKFDLGNYVFFILFIVYVLLGFII